MNYATIKNCDIANGPGVRVSLFVSGCTHHCKGCFNQEAWDFHFGKPFTQETIDRILAMLAPGYIRGLTLLGGEPFEPENQGPIVELLRQVKATYPEKSVWAFSGYLFDRDILPGKLDKTVWCFTGYDYEKDVIGRMVSEWEETKEFLSYLDVLVDGPFVEAKKDLALRFRGSSNQRLIDVPKTLKEGKIVLWEDWQGDLKGMK